MQAGPTGRWLLQRVLLCNFEASYESSSVPSPLQPPAVHHPSEHSVRLTVTTDIHGAVTELTGACRGPLIPHLCTLKDGLTGTVPDLRCLPGGTAWCCTPRFPPALWVRLPPECEGDAGLGIVVDAYSLLLFHGIIPHTACMTKKSTKAPAKKPAAATKTAAKAAPKKAAAAATEKIGKTQMVDIIADKAGLTKKQSEEVVSVMLESIVEAVRGGKSVGLPGLGTLSIRETAARTGVRPGTSERIQIPAGKKLAFKVATTLKGTL